MSDQFYNIKGHEMAEFLESQGFQSLDLKGVRQMVWAKIVKHNGLKFSLRIYSGINPSGESREKGKDAIHLSLHSQYKNEIHKVCGSRKCLRVKNWRVNLQKAIDEWTKLVRVCPACGAPQVKRKRNDRDASFWGCLTYFETKCRGYVSKETPTAVVTHVRKKSHLRIPDNLISEEQKSFESEFVDGKKHIIGGARAGSGKTVMLKHISSFRKDNEKWVYLAFGRKNASEGRQKMPRYVKSQTTHSFCSGVLRSAKVQLAEKADNSKTWTILDDIYPSMGNKERLRIRKATYRLVGLAKNFACLPEDTELIKSVFDQYSFVLGDENSSEEDEIETVLSLTSDILKVSLPGEKYGAIYDYDDMLWYVVIMNYKLPKIDVILADEVQDFNACQIWLLKNLAERGTRIVAVGDPYQAVFRFRGADCDAYYKVKSALEETSLGAKEMILSTNYRCCKAVIRHVVETTHVDDIEAAPNAIEGEVLSMSYDAILDLLTDELAAA